MSNGCACCLGALAESQRINTDYTQKAETWMKPLVRGNETGLVEIPGELAAHDHYTILTETDHFNHLANWYLDDLPPMMYVFHASFSLIMLTTRICRFIKDAPNSHGWVPTREVEQIWKDTFTYCYENEGNFVFPITIHPE